jgi:hypothetical protein
MTTKRREYYAKVPVIDGLDGDCIWSGLSAKTLTAAQFLATQNGCMTEIAVMQEAGLKVISAKNANGKWEVVYEGIQEEQGRLAQEPGHYHRNGKLVSREDFYEYGFKHEKEVEKSNKR